MRLYELTENFKNLEELIDDETISNELIIEALNHVTEDITTKSESICMLIKNYEGDIEKFKLEEKRLSTNRKTLENKIEGLKAYLKANIQATGLKKVKGNVFTITLVKSQSSLVIDDDNNIPNEYIKLNPTYNKSAIKDYLKSGGTFEGVKLVESESLRIK